MPLGLASLYSNSVPHLAERNTIKLLSLSRELFGNQEKLLNNKKDQRCTLFARHRWAWNFLRDVQCMQLEPD